MRKRVKQWTWQDVLHFSATPGSRATVRRYYARFRQGSGLPVRCDNQACPFHEAELVWNGKPLPLILDHVNGVSTDNRPKNLRLLCPNCESQLPTRGGRNKGRVRVSAGGYDVKAADGKHHYTLVAEPGEFRVTGGQARLSVTRAKAKRRSAGYS